MRTLNFSFEDLPLVSELGVIAGLVGGSAEIAYTDTGEWFIREIWLDGYDAKGKSYSVRVDYQWLRNAIVLELEGYRFNASITDAVVKAIEDSGDAPARPLRSEHATTLASVVGA